MVVQAHLERGLLVVMDLMMRLVQIELVVVAVVLVLSVLTEAV
jgi:hypothetical protein